MDCTLYRMSNIGNGRDNAFYNIFVLGDRYITAFGKRGSEGRYSIKGGGSNARAEGEAQKVVNEKRNKGYSLDNTSVFDVDLDDFNKKLTQFGNDAAGRWLNSQSIKARATQSSPRSAQMKPDLQVPTMPEPARVGLDLLTVMENRAKAAMTLAASASTTEQEQKVVAEHTILLAEAEAAQERLTHLFDYIEALSTLISY